MENDIEIIDGPQGGLGGGVRSLTAGRGIRDSRLIERALRERWPVKRKFRRFLMERAETIAKDPETSVREFTSILNSVAHIDTINQGAMEFAVTQSQDQARGQTNVSVNVAVSVDREQMERDILLRLGKVQPQTQSAKEHEDEPT